MQGTVERLTTAFDAREAASVIQQMEGYEEGLRRRTEGITWMIWALVFAGISMSYWVMGLLSPPGTVGAADVLPDRGLVTPWIGWVVAGGLAIGAVWRGAALREGSARRHVAALGAIMVTMWLLFIASWLVPSAITQYLYAAGPLALFGIATFIVVSTKLVPWSARGRRIARAAALVQVAVSAAYGILQAMGLFASPIVAVELLGTVMVGATWLGAGLWHTSQG